MSKHRLMLQFGGLDERVNASWPEYEKVLESNGVDYVAYVYEGVNHGFHNDSTGRYAPDEAELAWSRTIGFFNKYLCSSRVYNWPSGANFINQAWKRRQALV